MGDVKWDVHLPFVEGRKGASVFRSFTLRLSIELGPVCRKSSGFYKCDFDLLGTTSILKSGFRCRKYKTVPMEAEGVVLHNFCFFKKWWVLGPPLECASRASEQRPAVMEGSSLGRESFVK